MNRNAPLISIESIGDGFPVLSGILQMKRGIHKNNTLIKKVVGKCMHINHKLVTFNISLVSNDLKMVICKYKTTIPLPYIYLSLITSLTPLKSQTKSSCKSSNNKHFIT